MPSNNPAPRFTVRNNSLPTRTRDGSVPDFSHLFTAWTDPESGIRSWILTKRVAPLQQGFYFVNSAFSADNRFLWFFCAFPPAGDQNSGRTLGVVDFLTQEIRHFPETAFTAASPLVDAADGSVYWANHHAVCRRGPFADQATEVVAVFPEELYGQRTLVRGPTHLSFSPDKTELFIEGQVGLNFFGCVLNLSTRAWTVWKRFDRYYNHGQFSPTDRDTILLAQDHYWNPLTGEKFPYEDRLWILRRPKAEPAASAPAATVGATVVPVAEGEFQPVFSAKTMMTHEWWDDDGRTIWAINNYPQFGGPGIVRLDWRRPEPETVWPGRYWHAKDFNRGEYLVADRNDTFYRGCPSSVHFIHPGAGMELTIVLRNPEYLTSPSTYHIDPHPQFSPDGSLAVFAVTVLGRVDVAVVQVAELLARL